MRILLFVFCFATSLISLVNSQSCQASIGKVTITCTSIKKYDWWYIGTQLTCYGDKKFTSTFSDASVSSVVNSNRSPVTNLPQITGLWIVDATVKFIPNGIKTHFTKLKALLIQNCGLLSVNKDDLRPFGNSLERLVLFKNKLTSINADLFQYNPNIKAIGLNSNPLRHIEPNFFANLKNLKSIQRVELSFAGCLDQNFWISDGHKIATFKWKNEKCVDYSARIDTQLAPIKTRVQRSLNNELCLEKENAELKEQMVKLSKDFKKIKCQMNKNKEQCRRN